MAENRTCGTCGYRRDGKCSCYFSPRNMASVQPTDTCDEHSTPIEVDVKSICCTSVDCARDRISSLSKESIKACLEKESRSTVKKLLESRLRKLARSERRREDAMMDEIKRNRKLKKAEQK